MFFFRDYSFWKLPEIVNVFQITRFRAKTLIILKCRKGELRTMQRFRVLFVHSNGPKTECATKDGYW